MPPKRIVHPVLFLLFALIAVAVTIPFCRWIRGAPLVGKHPVFSESYGYGSGAFDVFVKASYDEMNLDDFQEFYRWMDAAFGDWKRYEVKNGTWPFPDREYSDLKGLCDSVSEHLASLTDVPSKVQMEKSYGASVHRMVKAVITRFSLQRGYEFTSVPRYGERQCFLQSVLIAGLFQQMGMNAGIVMVFRNEKGEESNNGHAVVLLRLPDEHDVIVDASEPRPFATHQGLFCNDWRGNIYVRPVYVPGSEMIVGYQAEKDESAVERQSISALDIQFIMSQFDVYRGEWVDGALHSSKKSREGLENAARYFRRSVNTCQSNPLAVYLLARSLEELNSSDGARQQFKKAYVLYTRYGWVPEGLKEKLRKYRIQTTS